MRVAKFCPRLINPKLSGPEVGLISWDHCMFPARAKKKRYPRPGALKSWPKKEDNYYKQTDKLLSTADLFLLLANLVMQHYKFHKKLSNQKLTFS